MTKARIVGWLVIASAAGAALNWWPETDSAAAPPKQRPPPALTVKSDEERFASLPARESIGEVRGELFAARSWTPPQRVERPAAAAAPAPVAAAAPQAPPLPYRFAGQVVHDGGARVVLARDDRVLTVREGDILDDVYRVESIRADQVTLLYLPLGKEEHLPVSSILGLQSPPAGVAAARPAQLRWEGPASVQAGKTFDVSLKVTSAQPVRASPLQLQFDEGLVEPVAVRPGGFFKNGSFNYRVNPGGSILIGAFGMGGVAADDEFLVVTFRPIRSGGVAELSVSSLALQGTAGVIAHDPPAAFRTTIVQ